MISTYRLQPFPLQTSSLFGGASGTAPNPVVMGPIGAGGIPRNVNIHIHTGMWHWRDLPHVYFFTYA